jgi:[glutamine synthetase] adenylyltransferase / [glutamine synthetase]-adenylyl-L-tyrosine phosphorylase
VLLRHRDSDTLRSEVLAMRERISASHPSQDDDFNVKHSRGGIIDVDFAVHHLVLRHAREWPEHTDNVSLLAAGAQRGLLPEQLAQAATAAFDNTGCGCTANACAETRP